MARLRLAGTAGRVAHRVSDHRRLLVAAGDRGDVELLERALDEILQGVAVALLERGALRLAVVGEDDDLVRPGRVPPRALDAPELLVELAQRLEGVGALEPGVVGDLVVAREGRVDGGAPAHHVGQDAEHDQVAHDHAHRPAQQRVDPAAVAARLDVAAAGADRRGPLQQDLPDEQHERARDVEAVREEGAVAGVRTLLGLDPADGQDHLVGIAREQVAAAGAAVGQQAGARGAAALDLGAVGRRGAGHHRPRLLLDPAERGDVLVRAEQDAGLAGAGLGGEVRLPFGEAVAILGDPARHVRGVAVAHRAAQHGQCEAVDLEEHDPRHVLAGRSRPGGARSAGSRAASTRRRRSSRR